jgi:hypothetical protein
MSRLLKKYISECPTCAVNSGKHHKPHGALQPIKASALPFEFIPVNFVFKLPESKFDGNIYDGFLSCTDLASKMVTLIPGRETYSAEDWARAFFYTYCRRWGVPNKILSDRGRVFLSDFWTTLFKMMRTDLLVTTAYHPQGDGQIERTNQTVEIALRHLVNASKTDWAEHLSEIEFAMNNSVNASTKTSPMEYLTGMTARTIQTAALPSHSLAIRNWSKQREMIRQDAADAITFAQTKMALHYDAKHKPVSFLPGQKVYINLQKDIGRPGYRLPNTEAHKLSQQRVGPFSIVRTVGRLAYELDIPKNWKIHPIISVAHLELAKDDSYARKVPVLPDLIQDKDGDTHEEWEVEEILRSRWRDRRNKKHKQYYVKWKGFGPEHNEWISVDELTNAPDLVEAFESRSPLVAVATTIVPLHTTAAWTTRTVISRR